MASNSAEIQRLADVVRDLRKKVEGSGTREQRKNWLAQQQKALKLIQALAAQNSAARDTRLPALQRTRNESATRLNHQVQQRLSTTRRFGAAARLARNDLQSLPSLMLGSMRQGYEAGFPRRKQQREEQVRTQQDTATFYRVQKDALRHNHEMFETARELVEPAGIEELMSRAFDAQVDVDALDHAAGKMRDMIVPERSEERPVVEQPRGSQAVPAPSEVRQSVMDWYDRETRSNARIRSLVSADLDLAQYQAMMAPEIPLRARQTEEQVRAQQDADQPPPMTAPKPAPAAHDYEAMMRPEADAEAMAYAQQIQTEATETLERIAQDQEEDWDQLGELDTEIERVTGFRNAADPANQPQYDNLLQTLAVDRMNVGRRLSARQRVQRTFEAERAREEVILHPDVIGDGSDMWDAEEELELMFSGLPLPTPESAATEEDVRAQQDVDQPGLPGAPGYEPPREPAAEPEADPDMENYTVQGGDTLTAIAREHGSSVRELTRLNQIEDPNMIQTGQVLRVPRLAPTWLSRAARTVFRQWPDRLRTVLERVTQPVGERLNEVWSSVLYQARLSPQWRVRQHQQELGQQPPPGDRNNNPGNLKHNPARPRQWTGMEADQTDPTFVQFTHPEYGIQAAAELLDTYYRSYGDSTITEAITRWAPSSDNNQTDAYVAAMQQATGGDRMDSRDPDLMFNLLKGIFRHEVGYLSVTDDQIRFGMALARDGAQFPDLLPQAQTQDAVRAQQQLAGGADAQEESEADATLALRMVAPAVGGGHGVSNAREAELNDALIEANTQALHLAQNIYSALGMKDEFDTGMTERQLRGEALRHAWRAASIGRQSGMMDTADGAQMIREAEAAAWQSWNQAMRLVDLRQAGWPERYDI